MMMALRSASRAFWAGRITSNSDAVRLAGQPGAPAMPLDAAGSGVGLARLFGELDQRL